MNKDQTVISNGPLLSQKFGKVLFKSANTSFAFCKPGAFGFAFATLINYLCFWRKSSAFKISSTV